MLLFELFPAFVMLVSLVVGVWLFVVDRQANEEPRTKDQESDYRID